MIIKSLIDTSIVVLIFAAWLPIENAASGFKGGQRPQSLARPLTT